MARTAVLRFFIVGIAALFVAAHASQAFAGPIIIGSPAASGDGNCFPFSCHYFDEYQQVYSASQFSGPITITALEFYNTQYDSGATSLDPVTLTIHLSETSANWNTLSSTMSSNIGGDNTLVFNGMLSQPWTFGDTLVVSLTTPFTYTPGGGNNLLLDVVSVPDTSTPSQGYIYFDYNQGNDFLGRVTGSGSLVLGFGLVTGFVPANVPEPSTLALFGFGLLGLAGMRVSKRTQRIA